MKPFVNILFGISLVNMLGVEVLKGFSNEVLRCQVTITLGVQRITKDRIAIDELYIF